MYTCTASCSSRKGCGSYFVKIKSRPCPARVLGPAHQGHIAPPHPPTHTPACPPARPLPHCALGFSCGCACIPGASSAQDHRGGRATSAPGGGKSGARALFKAPWLVCTAAIPTATSAHGRKYPPVHMRSLGLCSLAVGFRIERPRERPRYRAAFFAAKATLGSTPPACRFRSTSPAAGRDMQAV